MARVANYHTKINFVCCLSICHAWMGILTIYFYIYMVFKPHMVFWTTFFFRPPAHLYDWNIVDCDIKQLINQTKISIKCWPNFLDSQIDHFRDLPTDSQTTDITHFAVVFNYDITIKALEILRSTAKCLWCIMKNNVKVCDVRSLACKIKVLNGHVPGTWKWTIEWAN